MRIATRTFCIAVVFMFVIVLLPVNGVFAEGNDTKTIRVVMDYNYPPYSFRDNDGNLQGITIDQWQLFEKKTGIHVELTGMEWNKAFQAMKDGRFDVVDTISYNPEREKYLDFTKPYATIDVPIFFHKNISGITGVDSLQGFTVGAKKSDNAINVLKKNGITNVKVYESAEDVIKAAKNKEIVVFVMGKPPAMYYMYKDGIQGDFNYSESLYTSQFFRAVKEGNKELLTVLERGFGEISISEYRAIDKKWFGNTTPSIYSSEAFRYIMVGIVLVIGAVLLLILWNRVLQSRVRQKTKELSATIEELQASEARGRALLEAIPDIFFLLDKTGKIIDYHATLDDMLYTAPENFINRSLAEVFSESLSAQFLTAIREAAESGHMQTIEYSLPKGDLPMEFEARLVAYEKDRVIGIVRDITERKKSEEKLKEISIHDSLTGLFNRYAFESEIIKLMDERPRTLCLGVFDLDGLKLINDTMGHIIGDHYLVTTAQTIQHAFPEESRIFRIGGDEFCVIVTDKTTEDVQGYFKSFTDTLELFNLKENMIQISISFGYIFSEMDDINIRDMIREADNRMYRVKLHRRQSMKSEVVQTMKNMLEARDFITEGHATRMEELAVNLAAIIGIPEKDIADIRLLAQFHDIGKVGIPDHILFKPGKLTNEEFEIMKRHTEIGHRIAESSVDLLPIADFILKHHEFWNGKGYPFGIKETDIPIECRILSIVDAYDAMTNDRPYRKAMSKAEAMEELRRCAGSQFDPQLVAAFCGMMTK